MNKNIIITDIQTYHGSNTQDIGFELHSKKYFAKKTWDKEWKTISIVYGRKIPNEYYDTIATMRGDTGWMNNIGVSCIFGEFPEDLYNELLSQ